MMMTDTRPQSPTRSSWLARFHSILQKSQKHPGPAVPGDAHEEGRQVAQHHLPAAQRRAVVRGPRHVLLRVEQHVLDDALGVL